MAKRKDKNKIILRTGESYRSSDGRYSFRWTNDLGRRQTIYAPDLKTLRVKEAEIHHIVHDGLRTEAMLMNLNTLFDVWKKTKRGVRENTLNDYYYRYNKWIRPYMGSKMITKITKSDIKRFYIYLHEVDGLQIGTIETIHTILKQIFNTAVDDCYIRNNPTDRSLNELRKELEKPTQREALTLAEETSLLRFCNSSNRYDRWYPIILFMLNTGMRVNEVFALQWSDISFKRREILVNKTLSAVPPKAIYTMHKPKTSAGFRVIPLTNRAEDALRLEKERQIQNGLVCTSDLDGYSDFIFLNCYGHYNRVVSFNKALDRIVREYNDFDEVITMPHISSHIFRHTFATRLVELGVNPKVIQYILGHSDLSTTMNTYVNVTSDMKAEALRILDFDTKLTPI